MITTQRKTRITKLLLFTICLTLFNATNTSAQSAANHWIFGDFGLVFNNEEVTVNRDFAMFDHKGTSSYTDENGDLLLYTNGLQIWNSDHEIMANGADIFTLSTQIQVIESLVLKKPGSDNLFYVFTLYPSNTQEESGLYYSVVDMSLDGGLGQVVERTQKILSNLTNKIDAIYNFEEDFYWIATRSNDSGEFIMIKLNETGIDSQPVYNQIGADLFSSFMGQFKFSPDGKMAACAYGDYDWPEGYTFSIFDFDISSGILSNDQLLTLPENRNSEGISFSPDASKLYVHQSGSTGESGIYQFDLATWPNNIQETLYLIGRPELAGFRQLQLGPDGKIYFTKGGGSLASVKYLGIIHNPNEDSANLEFEELGLYLEEGQAQIYIPNFPQDLFFRTDIAVNNRCAMRETSFRITNEHRIDSVLWVLEEGMVSQDRNPTYTFSESGEYEVSVIIYYPEKVDTIEKTITIHPIPAIDLGEDRPICYNDQLVLNPDLSSYAWSNGITKNRITVTESGTYSVTVNNEFFCTTTDEVTLEIEQLPVIDLPTYISLDETGYVDLDGGIFESYAWSTGDTSQTITITKEGWYSLVVTNLSGCQAAKSVYVYEEELPDIEQYCDLINPNATTRDIIGMTFINDTDGFLITDYEISRTTDGGETWQIQKEIDFGRRIAFADNIGYLMSRSGSMYKSTYGGGGWNMLNTLDVSNPSGLSVVTADTIYITDQYDLHASFDGGQTWHSNGISFNQIIESYFYSSKLGFYITKEEEIYKTTDGGASWDEVMSSGFSASTGTLYFPSKHIGFASIDGDTYRTIDGGNSWEDMNITWREIYSFFFLNDQYGYAVGEYGARHKTTDGGSTWESIGADPNSDFYTLNALHFFDEESGLIAGKKGRIIRTDDFGTNWEVDAPTSSNITQIEFTDEGYKYVLAGDELFKASDLRMEWTNLGIIADDDKVNGIDFINEDVGFAIVGKNVYKTSNGGLVWSKYNTTTQIAPGDLEDIEFIGNSRGFVCCNSGQGGLYQSIDGGFSWNRVVTENIHEIHFVTDDIGYALAEYAVYKTTNSGDSWDTILNTENEIHSIHFPNPLTGYLVGRGNKFLKTTDTGVTWTELNSPTFSILDVEFYSTNTGYVVGSNGSTYKTENGGQDWENISFVTQMNQLYVTENALYQSGPFGGIMQCDHDVDQFIDLDKVTITDITTESAVASTWVKSNLDTMELILELGTSTGDYTVQFPIGTYNTNIDEFISYEIMDLQDSTLYFCRWKATMGNEEYTSEETSFTTNTISTSLTEISGTSVFKVFPNPASAILQIEPRSDLEFYSYRLRDISGKIIQLGKGQGVSTLDVSEIQSGVYFIAIVQSEKIQHAKVFIE